MTDTAERLRTRDEAVRWRRTVSGPLVFTNGVFDLLHVGHVELLEAARREGDALLVAINTDASARGMDKGVERPIVAEAARARLIAALAAVDCVVLFDEPTPLLLINALAPDVLVKGADYSLDRIVGAAEVERRGGRVVRIPLVSGYSTTALVERLRATS